MWICAQSAAISSDQSRDRVPARSRGGPTVGAGLLGGRPGSAAADTVKALLAGWSALQNLLTGILEHRTPTSSDERQTRSFERTASHRPCLERSCGPTVLMRFLLCSSARASAWPGITLLIVRALEPWRRQQLPPRQMTRPRPPRRTRLFSERVQLLGHPTRNNQLEVCYSASPMKRSSLSSPC